MTVILRCYGAGPTKLLSQASVKSDLEIKNNDSVVSTDAHAHQFGSQGNMVGVALISQMRVAVFECHDKPIAVVR